MLEPHFSHRQDARKPLVLVATSLGFFLVTFYWPVQPLGLGGGIESRIRQQNVHYLPVSQKEVSANMPLSPVNPTVAEMACCQLGSLGLDDQMWGRGNGDRQALLAAVARSLQYLKTDDAAAAYRRYPIAEITGDRVQRSLERFRELVLKSSSAAQLQAAVKREFVFYQSVGHGKGDVLFTAYYEPVYAASRVPTAAYRYPIYRLPPDLSSWPKPHPTRLELEGADGLQGSSRVRGLELFWLRSRMDAFLLQIEGSGRLQLTDGSETTVGYAGNTAYSYTSIGRELANDGKLPLEGMTMPIILQYFSVHPKELNTYLPRNRSFVFFQENHGTPAIGSINVPLTADRSIATDKSVMPPGALALLHAGIPFANATGQIEYRIVSRYVLDQDTGGAITGPGRVDYFLGTGKVAGDRAGVTVSDGQLYYLLLK